jgi:DNA modification methylase
VALYLRAIGNHRAEAIYDPFVGSGSAIIAAEQTSRRCYAMDIDPSYVDVAVKRWQDFTGQKAERL